MAIRRLRGEDLENQLNKGALWAVTYGDMMSYLMIFFLIMFSAGISKKGAGRSRGEVEFEKSLVNIQKVFGGKGSSPYYERAVKRDQEESMVTQLREALEKNNQSQYAHIESWDKKIRLVLSDAVMFDSGRAELKTQSLGVLGEVAKQLGALPNQVVIEGHTDNKPMRGGRYSSNWELSMERAYSVLRFLEEHGIESSRLSGAGYGEHRPVADNATPEGRAKNRRIEIDLLRTE